MNALELLAEDHRRVKELFEQCQGTEDKKQLKQLFKEIKSELDLHTRLEETIFYPAMEEHEELRGMVLESLEEHKQVKTILREMSKLAPSSERFRPKFKVLMDDVVHHAEEEEEGKMFPKIRELIESDTLGTLYYYDSTRVNLGMFQDDANVVWDLAPHDLSIMDYLIQRPPEAVVATGEKHVNGVEDVAFITAYFPDKIIAHLNVNWLSPVKVRTTLIGGEKKMLVWNDLEADEKIKVYDKGVKITSRDDVRDLLVSYRSGDVWAPKVEQTEALRVELGYFIDCIVRDQRPFNDGVAGLRVVQLLEAADQSLQERGRIVYL